MNHDITMEHGRAIRHPLTNHVYRSEGQSKVLVTDDSTGATGLFSLRGEWIAGDLRSADPFLCRWVENKVREAAFRHPLAGASNAADV